MCSEGKSVSWDFGHPQDFERYTPLVIFPRIITNYCSTTIRIGNYNAKLEPIPQSYQHTNLKVTKKLLTP